MHELGVRLDAADRQRHADLGVVAPLGGDRAPLGRADRGEDVLRRGLPHRAGDRDEAGAAAVAHAAGERRQRGEGVVGDKRCRGAAREARASMKSAPPPTATKRSPSSTRRESVWRPVTSVAQGAASSAPGASSRTSSSERGIMRWFSARATLRLPPRCRRTASRPVRLLPALVPLARDHDDVAGPGQLDRPADRRARSGSTSGSPVIPARISSMIACGSSLRGLSEVTIATSESSVAIRPISGRLPRSRSPPQPKTVIRRPRRPARARCAGRSRARPACGRSRRSRRSPVPRPRTGTARARR